MPAASDQTVLDRQKTRLNQQGGCYSSYYDVISHGILGEWPDLAGGFTGGGGASSPEIREASTSTKKKRVEASFDRERKKMKGEAEEGKSDPAMPKLEIQQSGGDGSKSAAAAAAAAANKTDYIHVRARRGQATDSHSLAERVRREKISERMKYLQDLVPGCNKITGKAGMLDEIINYVQSLQGQVEFLSMKLAAVNPRLDFNLDHFFSKEINPSFSSSSPMVVVSPESLDPNYLQFNPLQLEGLDMAINPMELALVRNAAMPVPNPFPDSGFNVQACSFPWDDDIQSQNSNVEFHHQRGLNPFMSFQGNIIHNNPN